jgi:hypothetical protein
LPSDELVCGDGSEACGLRRAVGLRLAQNAELVANRAAWLSGTAEPSKPARVNAAITSIDSSRTNTTFGPVGIACAFRDASIRCFSGRLNPEQPSETIGLFADNKSGKSGANNAVPVAVVCLLRAGAHSATQKI